MGGKRTLASGQKGSVAENGLIEYEYDYEYELSRRRGALNERLSAPHISMQKK